MVRVEAPVAGYKGTVADVEFVDGYAETDNPAAIAYFHQAGYGLDGQEPTARTGNPTPAIDARDAGTEVIGTPLRDAAVDPRDEDFLPPTNAGQADPHGPEVVAPTIHASGDVGPIVPGVVSDDPARQSDEESEVAEAVLVDQLSVPAVTQQVAQAKADDLTLGLEPEAAAGETVTLAPGDGLDPNANIDGVLAYVYGEQGDDGGYAEGWQDRAQEALDAEQAKGEKARSTLVSQLEQLLDEESQ